MRWLSLFQVLTVSARTPACAQPVQEEAGGALTRYSFTGERNESWKLPRRLREVSGLAATADDRLFSHDDERGIVYELDPTDGGVLKSFALGSPVPKDDFEGITVVDDHFFMVTSDGTLYEVPEGADGEHVLVNTFATDVGVLLGVLTFPDGAHRKAEGITFLSDSSLCLSDEGRSKRARLTRYRSGPP